MKTVDFTHLIEYFPWGAFYDDLGFAMPYPEVMMTSDKAYALQTQVSGLLMMQSWGEGNEASYSLEPVEATHEAYTLNIDLRLESIDEAWELIGVPSDKLHEYMRASILRYVSKKELEGKTFRSVPLPERKYMLVREGE